MKTTLIPQGLFAAKDFSSRTGFPCHFINPHPKIYGNSATEGKEKEREVEKKRKKEGRKEENKAKEGNTKFLRKKEQIKIAGKILDRYPNTKA